MLKMLGSLLLSLLILPSTLPQCTISPVNQVTSQATTTESVKLFAPGSRALGEIRYAYKGKFGKITCCTAETAVSNCDILELLRNKHTYLLAVLQEQGRHLCWKCWHSCRKFEELCIPGLSGQREQTTLAKPCTTPLATSQKRSMF
jgi:hypothetical protein